jgi:4-hydroxybenzoate polyprenyltransferase
LIFVPTLAAHRIPDAQTSVGLLAGFFALSFCASGFYIINDILDVESDRVHPVKKNRPLAAAHLTPFAASWIVVVLLIGSLALSLVAGPGFSFWLLVYAVTTFSYTMALKKIAVVDCFVLAALYSIRVVAGGSISEVPPSFWLLATSGFLFLSLAFGKRFAEISLTQNDGRHQLPGRSYTVSDAPVILSFGVSSAFIAVLVLSLYVNSDAVTVLYRSPAAIWAAVPILLLWVSSLWFRLWRGEVSDDPILFALKDRISLLAGFAMLSVVIIGAEGWLG